MKQLIKLHIEDCMRGFVNNYQNKEPYYERLDELFLLWARIDGKSFVESVEYFGLIYDDFHNKEFNKVTQQIIDKFPEELTYE